MYSSSARIDLRHNNRRRALAGRTVTVGLAVVAIVVVGLVVADKVGFPLAGYGIGASNPTKRQGNGGGDSIAGERVFRDVTADSGVDFVHVHGDETRYYFPELTGPGGAFVDYDNDGDLDLFLVQSGQIGAESNVHRSQLFRNDGSGNFENVTVGSGADVGGYGIGCAAADYDGDGDVDLYVTRLGTDVLLRNNGDGSFTNVSREAGIVNDAFSASASFFDFDRDGVLDIFVTNYVVWSVQTESRCYGTSGGREYCAPREYPPSVDKLYRGIGDGTFEDVTDASGIGSARGNGLAVLCTDLNDDGWVDVYVANDQTPAHYWVNQEDGTFIEDAAVSGCAFSRDGIAIAGMGIAAEDFDADGDYDLLVTNIRDQAHLCLRNEGGAFADVSHEWGFGGWALPFTAFGIGVFDQNHDGELEVFIANGAVMRLAEPFRVGSPYAMPNQFIRRDEKTGRYEDVSHELGLPVSDACISRGVILGDYDEDGDVDVVVTNNRGPVRFLRNETTGGHWTTLEILFATNGPAINARVELSAGGETHRREVRPGQGYLTSSDSRIHVGLGEAEVINKLTIRWPDGTVGEWRDLPVNERLRYVQGSAQ